MNGDAGARRRVAAEIRAACTEYGFLNVANLPLPEGLLERVSAKAREFFALPREVKEVIGRSDLDVISGYVGVAVEHLDTRQPGDLKESFSLNQASLKLLDRWSIPVAGFRETVLELHEAGARACAALVQAMALSLGAPEDFFVDKHAPHASTVRFFHYPPVGAPARRRSTARREPFRLRHGHAGLSGRGGRDWKPWWTAEWLTVPAIPRTVTVNVADLLSRWTNGIFRSPKHRVALPATDVKQSRYSTVFFYNPNSQVTVRCIDSCCGNDRPRQFPPIEAGEFLRQRRAAQYD